MTGVPDTSVAAPSVLVIATSACGANVSVSVAELFAEFGSVTGPETVAVFESVPVAPALIAQDAVRAAIAAYDSLGVGCGEGAST